MIRKVIRLAQKTHVVSLPARWVKRFSISKGDELELQEKGNTITISPKTDQNSSVTIVRIGPSFLRRMVDTPYRMGYHEIKFEYEDPSIYSKIENEVNNLMGFEIVSQGKGHCIAKNLAQGIESEFDTSLNRLFLVTIGFLEDIKDSKQDRFSEIAVAEQTTNRLAHFCKRMLNLGMTPDLMRSRSVYRIVSLLEEMGDNGKKICLHSGKFTQKEIKLLGNTIAQLRLAYLLFNRYDEKVLARYGKSEKENEKETIKLLKETPSLTLSAINTIIEQTKHLTEEIYPQSNSSEVV